MPPNAWHLAHREYLSEWKRQYRLTHKEEIAAYNQDYQKIYQPFHKSLYPEQYKARTTANHAIEHGRLTRQPCDVCGQLDVHAHHQDYAKPLEVVWLCPLHHKERHWKMLQQGHGKGHGKNHG